MSSRLQVRCRLLTDATEGRVRTGGMLPMLPVDSASLHAKLFLTEDDTRTHFCNDSLPGPGGCDGAGIQAGDTGRPRGEVKSPIRVHSRSTLFFP